MGSKLDQLVWITTVGVWISIFLFILRLLIAMADQDESRIPIVIFSFLVATLSQVGLFLSPWAKSWKVSYRLVVGVLMLPSFIVFAKIGIGWVSETGLPFSLRAVEIVGLCAGCVYLAQLLILCTPRPSSGPSEIA